MDRVNSLQRFNPLGCEASRPRDSGNEVRLAQILRSDLAVNLSVVLALVVGFIHGWLKLQFRHPATTFAFDFFLVIAVVLVLLRCGSLAKFIPPGPVGRAMLALYALCALYLPFALLPGVPPPLLAVVAIRSWCFSLLLFCVGYHLIRSPAHLRFFCLLTVVLAFGTSLYGLRQSPEEIKAMMESDPYYAARFVNQTYATSLGGGVRIFSTFVSSAGYGSTLAVAMIFALILATEPRTRPALRLALYVALAFMSYGVMQSGARSALAAAVLGCGVVLAYRRQWLALILVPTVLVVALALAGKATGGVLLERFSSLKELDSVALRFLIPAFIGLDYVLDGHPLGGGLGKSGFLPMFLANRVDYDNFVGADGDLGKLFIELGLPGFVVFGWLFFISCKVNWQYIRRFGRSPIGGLVLAAAINFYLSVLFFPIGSPYIGIPLGMLVWFFFGASQKLVELEEGALYVERLRAPLPAVKPRLGVFGQLLTAPIAEGGGIHAASAPTRTAAGPSAAKENMRSPDRSAAHARLKAIGNPHRSKIPFLYQPEDAK